MSQNNLHNTIFDLKMTHTDYNTVIDAGLSMMVAHETGVPMNDAVKFITRVSERMTSTDEPRFSLYDYADAFINSHIALDMGKLLNLNDDDFFKVMVASAEKKRETYSTDTEEIVDDADDLIDSVRAH